LITPSLDQHSNVNENIQVTDLTPIINRGKHCFGVRNISNTMPAQHKDSSLSIAVLSGTEEIQRLANICTMITTTSGLQYDELNTLLIGRVKRIIHKNK
jgi:hypothetical protein